MFARTAFVSSCRPFAAVYEATKFILCYLASLLNLLPLVFRPMSLMIVLHKLMSFRVGSDSDAAGELWVGCKPALYRVQIMLELWVGISLVIAIIEDRLGKNSTPGPFLFDFLASVEDMNPSISFRTIIDQGRQCLKLEVLFALKEMELPTPLWHLLTSPCLSPLG